MLGQANMKQQTHKEYIDSIEPHVSSWDKMYLNLLKSLLPKLESLENSLSIVIQGPLNERMKESIPIYLDLIKKNQHYKNESGKYLGNLVISYWDTDDESIISNFKNNKDIVLIKNQYNKLKESERRFKKSKARGAAPWILQNTTTSNGLNACTGYVSIKLRSDEIYPSLKVFYDKIIKDSFKIHTSDIFFRKDCVEKFHISDHIIGGSTNCLKKAFATALNMCKSINRLQTKFPEQLICKAILEAKGEDHSKHWKSKEIMKKNFNIVPISTMPNSIWTCSYRGYRELHKIEAGWLQNINEI